MKNMIFIPVNGKFIRVDFCYRYNFWIAQLSTLKTMDINNFSTFLRHIASKILTQHYYENIYSLYSKFSYLWTQKLIIEQNYCHRVLEMWIFFTNRLFSKFITYFSMRSWEYCIKNGSFTFKIYYHVIIVVVQIKNIILFIGAFLICFYCSVWLPNMICYWVLLKWIMICIFWWEIVNYMYSFIATGNYLPMSIGRSICFGPREE